ncbi:MAG: TerB family tellurite resistance protein [Bacteroidota bacterium]
MKERLSLLTELIKLSRADKKVTQDEYNFMLAMAKTLAVSKEDFDRLFNDYVEFDPPVFEADRIIQFYRMVLLMNFDQHVDDSELVFVREAGIRLGLSPGAVEAVFIEMKKGNRGMIPEAKLIEIFKTYHN